MRRLVRFLIVIPLLSLVWAYSNSIGVTQVVTRAFGLPDMDWVTIYGIDRVLKVKSVTDQTRDAAIEQAREKLTAEGKQALDELVSGLPTVAPQPAALASEPAKSRYRQATQLLAELPVKGRGPMTGYDRDEFGTEWSDAIGNWRGWSRNGCDSRNDALRRDLAPNLRVKPGTNGCKVLSGRFIDPYSGKPHAFVADSRDMAESLDCDHVVSLGNSRVSGGSRWTEKKRALIANDPLNLLAVDAGLNRQKSDGDAATWLPPNKTYRADYISRQIAVKAKYGLSVTRAEHEAMLRVLSRAIG
ncbi:MAG: HNH endonuclease family protein [Nocardioides sp.]